MRAARTQIRQKKIVNRSSKEKGIKRERGVENKINAATKLLCGLPLFFHVRFRLRQNNFIVVDIFYPAERDNVMFTARFRIAFRQLNFVIAVKMVNNTNVFTVSVNNLSVI